MAADRLIRMLDLRPLGFEGGYYRETHRSAQMTRTGEGISRSLQTAIYYLLAPDSRSLLHRLRSDEMYHFYDGDPVELTLLHPRGAWEVITLGRDLAAGHVPQLLVPGGVWQGGVLRAGGRFALMGTTMSPGFDRDDFELGRYEALARDYPDVAETIRRLTPTAFVTPGFELRAATRDLLYAELHERRSLCTGLGATVPDNWPAGVYAVDFARAVYDELGRSEARDWRLWYVIDRSRSALIGAVAFCGPPDQGEAHLEAVTLARTLPPERFAEVITGFAAWVAGAAQTLLVRAGEEAGLEGTGFECREKGVWAVALSPASEACSSEGP